jgi:cytochrome b involved in lipid metabolism
MGLQAFRKLDAMIVLGQYSSVNPRIVKSIQYYSNRVWVTYHSGVYDVTDFIPFHPRADKLLFTAGASIEPFWDILAVHRKNQAIHDRLESYRIGNLKDENVAYGDDYPYQSEPKRNSSFVIKKHLLERPSASPSS